MKKMKQNGFVLIILILALALVAAEMFILTSGSNTILFQANTAYLEACEQNLITSGLAWAENNLRSRNQEVFDKPINLNITDMNIQKSVLSITINIPENKETDVQIDSSVSRGRQTIRHTGKYHDKREP